LHPWQYLALGGTITLELIGDDNAGHIGEALEQRVEELLCRLLVAPALHQNVEHVIVLIHRPPQGMAFTMDRQKHFIQMPFVPRLRPSAPEPIRVVLPKLATPL